jgi:hypothetical protein
MRPILLALAVCFAAACSGSDNGSKIDAAPGTPDAPMNTIDAAPGTPDAPMSMIDAAAGGGAFGACCTTPGGQDTCDTGLVCFHYTMKGNHCTRSCTTGADCPETGTCSGMGVCGMIQTTCP